MKGQRGKAGARRAGRNSSYSFTFMPTLTTVAQNASCLMMLLHWKVIVNGISEKHNIAYYPHKVPNKYVENKKNTKIYQCHAPMAQRPPILLFQVCAFSNPLRPMRSTNGGVRQCCAVPQRSYALTINKRLLDLLLRRHHKRAILYDFLVQRFAGNLQPHPMQPQPIRTVV